MLRPVGPLIPTGQDAGGEHFNQRFARKPVATGCIPLNRVRDGVFTLRKDGEVVPVELERNS